jgi:L-amino acid N-acyltransferase YncA
MPSSCSISSLVRSADRRTDVRAEALELPTVPQATDEYGRPANDSGGERAEDGQMENPGTVRRAKPTDCQAIAQIYNEAIAERRSTFEVETRSAPYIEEWLSSTAHPVLVAERRGVIVGWARLAPYSSRTCYAGVGEGSIYVLAPERGQGVGSALAAALSGEAERAGFYKIVGKLFADNTASRRLVARHGFREVGMHLRHGRVDGDWRDVLVVERLIGEAAG